MIPKPLSEIQWQDIEYLVTSAVTEGRSIDFKRELPKSGDEDKRELLSDVSSFANTLGGDLVFGIEEANSVATKIVGVQVGDIDGEQLRLEEIIRSGIDPRIPNVEIRSLVDPASSRTVVIIRARRSYSAPHMVTFKNLSRFFARNSKGKYQLDIREIKAAFLGAEATFDRISRFRVDRIAKVLGGEPPVILSDYAPIFMHLVPVNPFRLDAVIENRLRDDLLSGLKPFGSWSGFRLNLDGIVTWGHLGDAASSYAQFFRNGAIETAACDIVRQDQPHKWLVIHQVLSNWEQTLEGQLRLLKKLDVPLPLVLLTSIVGVKGTAFYLGQTRLFREPRLCDRDTLFLPDVLIESYDGGIQDKLTLIKNAIGNAYGFERCPIS